MHKYKVGDKFICVIPHRNINDYNIGVWIDCARPYYNIPEDMFRMG
jgi:hypothetical protein